MPGLSQGFTHGFLNGIFTAPGGSEPAVIVVVEAG
jgi:hypothetical protein